MKLLFDQNLSRRLPAIRFFGLSAAGDHDGTVLETPHGVVETPVFMPVGTQATVKSLTPGEVRELGYGLILGNTYHLYLKPGDGLIARAGGLHKFIGWDRPILTDSGGYQVFSLAARRKVHEEGATFRSHLDGTEHLLTPESAVEIQGQLGSDIAMVLDECPPSPIVRSVGDAAWKRTLSWARRARAVVRRLLDFAGLAPLGRDPAAPAPVPARVHRRHRPKRT